MRQTNTQFIKTLNKQSLKKFNILIQIVVDTYQTFKLHIYFIQIF
jgi:hypothetical protein